MNNRYIHIFLALVFLISGAVSVSAQKKITPVDNDPNRPQQPVLHYYDKHGNPLEEPVLFLADTDTVKKVNPGPVYPLLQSMSFGFNFFDAAMLLAGQKYASFDVWAELSLHNWIQPVVELGIGYADDTPEEGNYHYKSKPSIYGKIGVNYNFLYKSNPDYQLHFGLRGGFSTFRYDITDITVNSSYWDQGNTFSILNQKATSLYGEVLAGIRVKIWKNISMGWDFRYHFKMKTKQGSNSNPWFIPGYGANSPINASFSLIYTIPFKHKEKKKEVDVAPDGEAPALPAPEENEELPERL